MASSGCASICKRIDRWTLLLFAVYATLVLLFYIAMFAVNPGSVIQRAPAPASEDAAPEASPSALPLPPSNSTEDAPAGGSINGGITIAILLYFFGLGAPGVGILGMFVVLLAMRERQKQFLSCCLICLLPFLIITWIFVTVAEIMFVSPATASLSLPSPAKGVLLLLSTLLGLLTFIAIFVRGMCYRKYIKSNYVVENPNNVGINRSHDDSDQDD